MIITDYLRKQFIDEGSATRKMLALVREDDFGYKPHDKSMDLKTLASHLADLPGWVHMTLTTNELDFATSPEPAPLPTADEMRAFFEKRYADGLSVLTAENESLFGEQWTLRHGEMVYYADTKLETLRHSLSQQIHHRAQLGVYLRLLDIPIPGSYGPSADETSFT